MKIVTSIVCTMTLVFCVFAFGEEVKKNALIEQYCSTCHTTDRVYAAKKSPGGWDSTVSRMVSHGLDVTPEVEKQIKEFLYTLR